MSQMNRRKYSIIIDDDGAGSRPGYARQARAAKPFGVHTQQLLGQSQSPVDGATAPSRNGPKKRSQVRNACMHCRNDKVKCSGTHPICVRCNARSLACEWDVPEEGITKMQHLQNRLAEAAERLDRMNAVVNILCHGTDKEASEALARLRIGESLEEVLVLMGTQNLSSGKLEEAEQDRMVETIPIWSPREAPMYDPLLLQTSR